MKVKKRVAVLAACLAVCAVFFWLAWPGIYLSIASTDVTDLEPLRGCRKLRRMELTHPGMDGYGPIRVFPGGAGCFPHLPGRHGPAAGDVPRRRHIYFRLTKDG